MFFSKIRQRFGNNNNPNALELRTALKQILLKNSISSSYAANCIALDNTGSESIFEIRWSKKTLVDNVIEKEEEDENISDFLPNVDSFDLVKDNILYYICGFIVKSVYKKIDCQTCANSMVENEIDDHNYSHKYLHSILVDVKNRGGLIKSSKNVVVIVKLIERTLIQLTSNFCSLLPGLSQKVILAVKNYVYNYSIFNDLNCENDSFLENHKLNLVTLICKQYLKVRLHYVAKLKTSSEVSKRRLLTKLILFNHQ